tara:strand:+ start:1462 stop:1776 length:315 start_codon:yes stop_codon:yes gene_type:complete
MVETRSIAKARKEQENKRKDYIDENEKIDENDLQKKYNINGKFNNYNLNLTFELKKEDTIENTPECKVTNEINEELFNLDDYKPFVRNQYKNLELKYHSICNIM